MEGGVGDVACIAHYVHLSASKAVSTHAHAHGISNRRGGKLQEGVRRIFNCHCNGGEDWRIRGKVPSLRGVVTVADVDDDGGQWLVAVIAKLDQL